MLDFIQLTRVHDVPDPGKAYFELDDRMIVLFHVEGEFFCLDDVCTHDGGPLGEGLLEDHTIACPRHGAKFDIRTGAALTMPATQATRSYELRIENGIVYVRGTSGDNPLVSDIPTPADVVPADVVPGPTIPSVAVTPAVATNAAPAVDMTAASSASAIPTPGLNEDVVFEELKKVIDPELFVNIVDLGLVYVVDVQPGAAPGQSKVLIEMTMTSPACPAGPQLIQNSKTTVGHLPGVESVEVKIVMDPPWTPDKMTEAARDHLGIF